MSEELTPYQKIFEKASDIHQGLLPPFMCSCFGLDEVNTHLNLEHSQRGIAPDSEYWEELWTEKKEAEVLSVLLVIATLLQEKIDE